MLRNTHAVWGIATAAAVTQCSTIGQVIAVSCTGALGGLICDIDMFSAHNHKNRLARVITGIIVLLVVMGIVDFIFNTGFYRRLYSYAGIGQSVGFIGFIVLCVIFMAAAHRKFSHSLVACLLSSVCVYLIYPPVCIAYAAGFLSHLALDLLNKKPQQLFFPAKKGVCLNLVYSDKTANTAFFVIGAVLAVVFPVLSVIRLIR